MKIHQHFAGHMAKMAKMAAMPISGSCDLEFVEYSKLNE